MLGDAPASVLAVDEKEGEEEGYKDEGSYYDPREQRVVGILPFTIALGALGLNLVIAGVSNRC